MLKPIRIGKRVVGPGHPAYIIAEIGSNFDGSLERAKKLAKLCKEAGADAYKIQNFLAPKLVSAEGFKNLQVAHQAKWKKSAYEVYKDAEFPRAWVKELAQYCKKIGIDFFSSPYDFDAVDMLEDLRIVAHKIGSGEIDNLEFLRYIAKTGKPIILATGAATMSDIESAVKTIRATGNKKLILLQCVTSYPTRIADANLSAMVSLQKKFNVVVGYSDHTIGEAGGADDPLNGITVPLGTIALGGCVIEKHVTDDRTRPGQDHAFALTMEELSLLVKGVRAMEAALGSGTKELTATEKKTSIIQRRGMFATRTIAKGEKLKRGDIVLLRPATGLRPPMLPRVVGKAAKRAIKAGAAIQAKDVF